MDVYSLNSNWNIRDGISFAVAAATKIGLDAKTNGVPSSSSAVFRTHSIQLNCYSFVIGSHKYGANVSSVALFIESIGHLILLYVGAKNEHDGHGAR